MPDSDANIAACLSCCSSCNGPGAAPCSCAAALIPATVFGCKNIRFDQFVQLKKNPNSNLLTQVCEFVCLTASGRRFMNRMKGLMLVRFKALMDGYQCDDHLISLSGLQASGIWQRRKQSIAKSKAIMDQSESVYFQQHNIGHCFVGLFVLETSCFGGAQPHIHLCAQDAHRPRTRLKPQDAQARHLL